MRRCRILLPSFAFVCLLHAVSFAAKPEIFSPGAISGPANDGTPTFTPDGGVLLFTRSGGGWAIVMESHKQGSGWSEPVIASFSGVWPDMQPEIAPDGSYAVFVSTRPVANEAKRHSHLWRVERKPNGWGTPTVLPEVIHVASRVFKPSIASDGTLYFMASEPPQKFRIYAARYTNGNYQKPEALPFSDGQTSDVDPEIAPDGTFLLFSSDGRTPSDTAHEHLFLVKRTSSGWGPVTAVHHEDEAQCNENEARVSRNGQTLMFASDCTVPAQQPFSPEQALEALDRAARWDNGNYNVWTLPMAGVLPAPAS